MASTSNLDDPRRHVKLEAERVSGVSSTEFPGHYPGEDHSWDLERFKENLIVKVHSLSESSTEFDLVGLDSSLANALRRIMIAEVPSVAIEDVYIYTNTSIVQDEVLAHRLGMVPLNIHPRHVNSKAPGETPTDANTVVFNLDVTCERKKDAARNETNPDKLYTNHNVYSSDIIWTATGRQSKVLEDKPAKAVVGDILLAKMRPGQKMEMELHAVKGIGKDHAKFSPVATASYRLLPHIKILSPIPQADQLDFQRCFAPGVIAIEDGEVVVKDARKDTVSREVLRHEKFEGKVELARIRDHFIYSVETTGAYMPEEILPEAIQVLLSKIANVEGCLKALEVQHGTGIETV